MNIITEDEYEAMATTYQCLEIARLNEVLKQHGIDDAGLRRQICTQFMFDSGEFLDTGWFVTGSKRVYPELCFAERAYDEDEGPGEIETLHANPDTFSFHEYAAGDVGWYFDEQNEDVSEIEADVI